MPIVSQRADLDHRTFRGKWKLLQSHNFDGYMQEIGVGWLTRALVRASNAKLIVDVSEDGTRWTITSRGAFRTW